MNEVVFEITPEMEGERIDKKPSVPSAPRLDEMGTVFLDMAEIPHRDVGPRDARLQ